MNASEFVFLDPKGRRWGRVRRVSLVASAVLFVVLLAFVNSLFVFPRLRHPGVLQSPETGFRVSNPGHESIPASPSPPVWLKRPPGGDPKPIVARVPTTAQEPVVLGFYPSWSADGLRSLQSHYAQITHVAPEWFSMKSFEEPLVATPDEDLLEASRARGVKLLPRLSNLDGRERQPEVVEDLARHPDRRPAFFARLTEQLREMDAAGVLVDWEQIDPVYRQALTGLIGELAGVLHESELELWLGVPVGGEVAAFDLDALAPAVDRFVAQLYDENGEEDMPGPLASQPWWNAWLDVLLEHGTPQQWIVGIGNYGYDWPQGKPAVSLGFADVMARIKVAKTQAVTVEAPLYQPHFRYEEGGIEHAVWFLDATTLRNQWTSALKRGVGGMALFSLGTEDPGVWTALARPGLEPRALERLTPGDAIANIGAGDLLTVSDERRDGLRTLSVDAHGLWQARYDTIPQYPLIYHRGWAADDQVVLSFDDGPDPLWTPPILDILKAEGVHAVFFMVGERAIENPEIVRRILAEGHEIGNHSYSHPDLSQSTAQRTLVELNANQRILEKVAGISTLLFRPPYHADTYPESMAEFTTLARAQSLGYLSVTESIDSEDWNEPTPETLLARVKERRNEGNVILFHDGGGDRSATVAALPRIIRALRARGDRIVTLQPLLGLPREILMPPIPADDPADSRIVAQTGLAVVERLEEFAWAFMIGITAILFVRTLIVMFLALQHRRLQRREPEAPNLAEPVSVLIAAYNEAKVVAATLRSVLDTDYAGAIEAIVVDDGSTDETARIVSEMAAQDPRIRLVSQTNQGKAHALNRGLGAASSEFVVMLDADTQFRRPTIRHLVAPLADPQVGAVSGHVRVGNLATLIARFQSLEYICGFNLDRRAYDRWNAVTVVPGATSAFRKSAIAKAGGILADTMAEDTDLTFYLHRAGYRIRYAPKAVAYTEAPDSVRGLVKQRIRWAFGTLQCLWKHRDLTFRIDHPGLGFFSLPSIWFCQIFLVAMVPIVDAALLASLFWGAGVSVVQYALFFFVLEWAMAAFGCYLEQVPLRTSLWIFPMRILYRPLLCFAVWTSIVRALRGAWYGWGKLDRKGTVGLAADARFASPKIAA